MYLNHQVVCLFVAAVVSNITCSYVGVLLSATKLHEMNLTKSLPSPWATSLVAMVPSSIRSEAGELADVSIN